MKLVETPPGPPVIASVVAEIYGQPDSATRICCSPPIPYELVWQSNRASSTSTTDAKQRKKS
jgi:hypothetical protein